MALIKWVAAGDNHGDLVNPEAVTKLLRFCEDFKPKYKVHLGDGIDARPFRHGATISEQESGISRDLADHWAFMDVFKPRVYTMGNHCYRLWREARSSRESPVTALCGKLVEEIEAEFKRRKCELVPYWHREGKPDYWQAPEGGPFFCHGRTHPKNLAQSCYNLWEHPTVTGHGHRADLYQGRNGISVATPGLLDLSKATYSETKPNVWTHSNGWAFGIINSKTGKGESWLVKKTDGVYLSPMGEV